jgi:hypothetical protein
VDLIGKCYVEEKVPLWGLFRFEISNVDRLRKVENLKGSIQVVFDILNFKKSNKTKVSLR